MAIEQWLSQAKRDLETAEYLLEGLRFKEASFFCQQAAEKALKAFIIHKNKELIRTHDLVRLAKLVDLPVDLETECDRLTQVYIDTRYPDTGLGFYSKAEVEEDLMTARRITQWVEKHI